MFAAKVEHLLGLGDTADVEPDRLRLPMISANAETARGFGGAPTRVRLPSLRFVLSPKAASGHSSARKCFGTIRGITLIYTVDLPLTFQVEEASEERPYLGFRLDLEPALVASVIMESGIRIKKGDASTKAMNVSSVDADLLDAVVRLVRLVETPAERKVLAPLIIREIIYRLLIGGQGARLSHILASGGDTRRISKAIGHLREHFDEQLKMEEIARELGMSVSGFHHHFKSVTSMSPLQFQKHLRLQEARRLMLGEDMDAASAGFRVGYEDPSHFSREYKRHFGAPPHGDIASLRSRLEASQLKT